MYRPPEHIATAEPKSPSTLILIGGGSGAGKTSITKSLSTALGPTLTTVVPLDAYYRDRSHMRQDDPLAENFDSPDALDHQLLDAHIRSLLTGESIKRPRYNYQTHRREKERQPVSPRQYLVIEGLFALYWPALRAHSDVAAFVTISSDLALTRRIQRDTQERGGSETLIRTQWENTVWPMYLTYVEPTRQFADLVIDGTNSVENSVETLLRYLTTSHD